MIIDKRRCEMNQWNKEKISYRHWPTYINEQYMEQSEHDAVYQTLTFGFET